MDWLLNPELLIALLTLTVLEIVLGIDNIIFIAIIAGRLPPEQQAKGRTIGLALAMITRIALLFSLTVIMRLTAPLFTVFSAEISGRDIILILYFAMAFSVFVEMLNLRIRRRRVPPVQLRRFTPGQVEKQG